MATTSSRAKGVMTKASGFKASAQTQSSHTALTSMQKYTVQPQGIWARINRIFAIDSGRSTGVPFNPQFRNPPPGALDPKTYDDPVTMPAGDIAENPYWKRDVRRAYPKLSVMSQPDVVALLTVGSAAAPKETLQIGDAGNKQLVELKEGQTGLSTFFQQQTAAAKAVLGPDGLPPLPASRHLEGKKYVLEAEQTYEGKYPCRTFS